jgi:hypothetical protein
VLNQKKRVFIEKKGVLRKKKGCKKVFLSKADISSKEFSFQGKKYLLCLIRKEGGTKYGCCLQSIKNSSNSVKIHFRFDLVKRLDNTIAKSEQLQHDIKDLKKGWGLADWCDPTTIRDHILCIKMWISDYDFECDLDWLSLEKSSFLLEPFKSGDNTFRLWLVKKEEGTMFGRYLSSDSAISGKVYFQVDLFKRLDGRLVRSDKFACVFEQKDVGLGHVDVFDAESIREHVLKVKVLKLRPFSDFVEKPIEFKSAEFLLFDKMISNLSFMVGKKAVYVLRSILTSRNAFFRAMLESSFQESQARAVKSKIPIYGVDVEVFKIIIEWIYTMDIKRLNDPFSPTLLLDLQSVYLAAETYLLPDLSDAIGKYLKHLLTSQKSCQEKRERVSGKVGDSIMDIEI